MKMTLMLSLLAGLLALPALTLLTSCGGSADTYFATIGTGSQTGVYYPTGEAITKMVNAKSATYDVHLTFESTGGSVFNINAITGGDAGKRRDMEFGIVQSDLQFQAYEGIGKWQGDARANLRAVFSIHPEYVTLVAAEESGIRTLADLRGKHVNLDSPGSGTLQNAEMVLRAIGIDPDEDIFAERVSAKEGPSLLQDGRVDAFFFTAAHPNGALLEATSGTRAIRFIPITGPEIEQIVDEAPYMTMAEIPLNFYPKATNQDPVSTIAVKATLCTHADVPDDVAYAVAKEVFENLGDFKKLHQAYSQLTPERMLEALSAPIHPGALRYYKEAGLIVQ